MDSHTDVVVVGAGAAGISAAYTLIEKGLDIIVVEAAERIGGRCWTDLETFGVPYDVGAHWLHYGDRNFFLAYGKETGFDLYPDAKNFSLYRQNQKQPNGLSTIQQSHEEYWYAIQQAIDSNRDISVADATALLSSERVSDFIYGPWIMGKEIQEFSVFEYSGFLGDADWFCRQGFGTIVARYGATLPVSLKTEVNAIDWSGDLLKIKTNQGAIGARTVIVTVSTGVLSGGGIQFSPNLSIAKQEAFSAVSMGCYEHVVLQFNEDSCFRQPDTYIICMPNNLREGFGALANISSSGLTFCDIGGNLARELIALGEEACIDYALGELVEIFGSSIKKNFIKGAASAWLENPYTLGSYASAEPGAFQMRATLNEPVGERIFFAGEACHCPMWATVAGAFASGQEVANKVSQLLR
ncbi:MAG: FAD-dependent oxidoreductase [Gammaproteobacteria bacterium]|nr:FAD-dependent oxidoreductase [Gammaproteobacteria bacterium]